MPKYYKNDVVRPPDSNREFLRAVDVARKLGISRDLVLQHLRNKTLPGFKLGKVWLVRSSELDRYLSEKEALFTEQDLG